MSDQAPIARRAVLPSQAWRRSVMSRLEELVRLRPGWDGYRGVPVSLAHAVFALELLDATCFADTPAPVIVPGPEGDLQIEWHTQKLNIEFHVRAPGDVEAWRSVEGGNEELLEPGSDFSAVAVWIKHLTETARAVGTAAA